MPTFDDLLEVFLVIYPTDKLGDKFYEIRKELLSR